MSTGTDTRAADPTTATRSAGLGARVVRAVLTQRIILLVVLIVLVLSWMFGLSAADYLTAPYDLQ